MQIAYVNSCKYRIAFYLHPWASRWGDANAPLTLFSTEAVRWHVKCHHGHARREEKVPIRILDVLSITGGSCARFCSNRLGDQQPAFGSWHSGSFAPWFIAASNESVMELYSSVGTRKRFFFPVFFSVNNFRDNYRAGNVSFKGRKMPLVTNYSLLISVI